MEISKIREMAKLFADIPIYDTRVGGVASHPFTNTWITGIYDKDRKLTLVDLRKEDEQAKWREQIKAKRFRKYNFLTVRKWKENNTRRKPSICPVERL